MSKVMLIDYENVQGINLSEMQGMDFRVKIFTGSSQSKIPIELVTSAQVLGNRLEWIRIDGSGPNALDFHIAYYLGTLIAKDPGDDYFILSKDKGFDPLIKYITKGKTYCRRILAISDVTSIKAAKGNTADEEKVLSNIRKIEKGKRPRNTQKLKQYVKNVLGKSVTEEKLNQTIVKLFSSKAIVEENGKLTYKI